jgi:hypothetical protein
MPYYDPDEVSALLFPRERSLYGRRGHGGTRWQRRCSAGRPGIQPNKKSPARFLKSPNP